MNFNKAGCHVSQHGTGGTYTGLETLILRVEGEGLQLRLGYNPAGGGFLEGITWK